MALLFARQPIFDNKNKIYGYELLYRESDRNAYDGNNGDAATSSVMAAEFLSTSVSKIAGKRRAFINFTESMLLHQVATLFPKEQIVVEVLEDIEPTEEIVEACRNLKTAGYTLALDDFVFRPGYEELIKLADIIKVDFMLTKTEYDRKNIVRQFGNGKIKFLAEKVESYEEVSMAARAGYSLFQGYYFSKPVITSFKGIPPAKMNHINLIKLLEDENFKFADISEIIEKDVAFSYEILRIANSSYYYRGHRVVSVRQAAIRMGLDELKKWAFITVLRKVGEESQDEIVNLCVQRAKTLELLCRKLGMNERRTEFFTLGMFSMIDVLAGCPMELLLPELPISEEAKRILAGDFDEDRMSVCYKLTLLYEKGEWTQIFEYADRYAINIEDVSEAYFEAAVWGKSLELN